VKQARPLTRLIVATALAGAATLAQPAPPAEAAPTHVAIVVAGAGVACVPAGGTGLDLLTSHYTVDLGQQPPYVGFVLTINGSGTTRPDDRHYWSYWHDTGSGWTYSSAGSASYTPRAGTVEGWSYVNGSAQASPPSTSSHGNPLYQSICAGSDPTPSTSHPPTPTHAPPTRTPLSNPTTRHATAGHASASHPLGTSRVATLPTTSHGGHPTRSAPHPGAAPSTGSVSTSGQAGVPVVQALPSAPPVAHRATSAMPAWGAAFALVVIATIVGAAIWRTRRRGA
jgi:hypothetical protein